MANKGLLIFGAVAVGGAIWYIGSNAGQLQNDVSFYPADVRVGGSFFSPQIIIRMVAHNPGTGTAKVNALKANIIFNGAVFGTVVTPAPFTIAPGVDTPFDLPINISDLSVLTDIVSAITGNINTETITVDGSANVDGIAIPFNKVYNL